jgi:hypothetical protein
VRAKQRFQLGATSQLLIWPDRYETQIDGPAFFVDDFVAIHFSRKILK